jgi:hypothetical protein
LHIELPGKVLPPLPKKNKTNSTASNFLGNITGTNDSEASSISSASTQMANPLNGNGNGSLKEAMKSLTPRDHRRTGSSASARNSPRNSPRPSTEGRPQSPVLVVNAGSTDEKQDGIILYRENQRISLRAFLRTLLHNQQIAQTKAIQDFLSHDPITPMDEDVEDIVRRKAVDEKRVEEQQQFYEIARKRAAELDVYMEQ